MQTQVGNMKVACEVNCPPDVYLEQYWPPSPRDPAGWEDNIVLMDAYQEAGLTIRHYFGKPVRVLDVGTGPALAPLLGIITIVDDVQLSDYDSRNRLFLKEHPIDYWHAYISMLTKIYDDPTACSQEILEKLDILRSSHEPIEVNLFNEQCFSQNVDGLEFDLITMNFVADSICQNKEEYFGCLGRVLSLVAPSKALIMSALVDAKWWQLGSEKMPSPRISEHEISEFLINKGLTIKYLGRSKRLPDQTYDGGWVVISATRT